MSKNIIVVDIDGTIARVGDRLKYLQQDKPDWDSFYEHCDEDAPIEDMVRLVEDFYEWDTTLYFVLVAEKVYEKKQKSGLNNILLLGGTMTC